MTVSHNEHFLLRWFERGKVYDNIHTSGIPYDDWIKDILTPFGGKVF